MNDYGKRASVGPELQFHEGVGALDSWTGRWSTPVVHSSGAERPPSGIRPLPSGTSGSYANGPEPMAADWRVVWTSTAFIALFLIGLFTIGGW